MARENGIFFVVIIILISFGLMITGFFVYVNFLVGCITLALASVSYLILAMIKVDDKKEDKKDEIKEDKTEDNKEN